MWQYRYPSELKHYASRYYDPKKAHEYYEQHKQLKGRNSTANLTDEGKKIASYVKGRIDEEKTSKLEAETERHRKNAEAKQEQKQQTLEQHRQVMSQRINSLNNTMKRMTKQQRAEQAPRIRVIIDRLQKDNDKKRTEIENHFRISRTEDSKKSLETKAQIRSEANAKYEDELAKIVSEYTRIPKRSRYK